jgi:pre-mRNA-splicing factor SPF27
MESEVERIASKTPLTAIDLSRYEASSTVDTSTNLKQARQTLQAAYTNSSYLGSRLQALELLEQFGKNAWLVGNSQLEDVLRGVEKDLVETKQRTEVLNRERKGEQEGGRATMEVGEKAWREGVGRIVEVQLGISGAEERWRDGLRSEKT